MTKLLEYHQNKCKYYLDTLEVVLNALVDNYNRTTLLSMVKKNKERYELHKAFVEELEEWIS